MIKLNEKRLRVTPNTLLAIKLRKKEKDIIQHTIDSLEVLQDQFAEHFGEDPDKKKKKKKQKKNL
jgi:hypothetical protein